MSGIGIWLGALLLYGAFSLWYNSWRGPLGPEEIETYAKRWEQSANPPPPDVLETARAFFESDDGGEFFMLNLIRLHPGEVPVPGSDERQPAQKVLRRYTGYFMPQVLRRAGHPAFLGPAAGRYMEHWGVEPDPGWTFAGIVRYRSRRDLMELTTDPRFDPAHVYKITAMANTLAFPVAPATLLLGPRVWVALLLALLAALGHLTVKGSV
jgi:hypothetical protein